MNPVVIQVEGLSKQYRLGEVSTGSLHHDLNRWWHRIRGKEDPYLKVTQANVRESTAATPPGAGAAQAKDKPGTKGLSAFQHFSVSAFSPEYVWALKDVSFEVRQGEVLGIIGRNGAGKSTLLKILSRITAPTSGEVRIRGRIGALLEIGTGFHQDLTGRENIYLNGSILGMTKAEIAAKLDEIVDFSGCARYIDTPVKRYSSGMMVRLGFAVAAHLEPEILVVDEVLAVGDSEFQRKCLGKMQEVAGHGRTVLFVSHNLGSIQTLCQTAVWMDAGRVRGEKDQAAQVVAAYEQTGFSGQETGMIRPDQHRVRSPFQLSRVEIVRGDGRVSSRLRFGEPVRIRLSVACWATMDAVSVGIGIRSHGVRVATLFSEPDRYRDGEGVHVLECTIPGGALLPGLFEVDVGASRAPGNIGLDYVPVAAGFAVSDVGATPEWVHDRRETGIFRIRAEWVRGRACEGEGAVADARRPTAPSP